MGDEGGRERVEEMADRQARQEDDKMAEREISSRWGLG